MDERATETGVSSECCIKISYLPESTGSQKVSKHERTKDRHSTRVCVPHKKIKQSVVVLTNKQNRLGM